MGQSYIDGIYSRGQVGQCGPADGQAARLGERRGDGGEVLQASGHGAGRAGGQAQGCHTEVGDTLDTTTLNSEPHSVNYTLQVRRQLPNRGPQAAGLP